jgi:putative membrane protein
MKKNTSTIDSNYIQQHLANERTFLAWIRTALAIIGVGFLFHSLILEATILIFLILGLVITSLATVSYYQKKKAINEQVFLASNALIFSFAIVMFLSIILLSLFILLID